MDKKWSYITFNSLIIGWSIVWAVALIAKHPNGASLLLGFLSGSLPKTTTIIYWAPLYAFVIWVTGCAITALIIWGGEYLFNRIQKPSEYSNESNSKIIKDRIVINCIHCGEKLKVPPSETPISVVCPHCDKRFQFRVDPADNEEWFSKGL